jgi:predicted enzyme related to lactoylglutathione lyase
MEIPAVGVMAYVSDPSGAGIGVFQNTGDMSFGYDGVQDGTPAWFELHTKDFATAVGFYEKVFGWDTHNVGDSDEFRYTTLGTGDDQKAGVMDAKAFLPEGVPSYWTVYIRVADADATASRATELGGSVVDSPEDTPYGRLATLADPAGARFKLLGPNTA